MTNLPSNQPPPQTAMICDFIIYGGVFGWQCQTALAKTLAANNFGTRGTTVGITGTAVGTTGGTIETTVGTSGTTVGTSGTTVETIGTAVGTTGTSVGTSGTTVGTNGTTVGTTEDGAVGAEGNILRSTAVGATENVNTNSCLSPPRPRARAVRTSRKTVPTLYTLD